MSTSRTLKACGIAATLVLALAGCVKMDISLDLQPDDTVDGQMTVAVSEAIVEMSGEDPDTLVEQMQSDLFDNPTEMGEVRVEPYSDDDFVGSTTFFEGAALSTFGSGDDETLSIVRDGDEFVVTGAMDLSGDEADQLGALVNSIDVRVAITFPGEVSEHTGELDGRTVVWTPKIGEVNEISARGSAVAGGGGGLSWLALVGIGLAVLAVIAVVLVLLLRNRNRDSADDVTPVAETPPGTLYEPGAPTAGPAAGSPVQGVPPIAPPPLDAQPPQPTASTPPAAAPPDVIPPVYPAAPEAPEAPPAPQAPEAPETPDESTPPPPR